MINKWVRSNSCYTGWPKYYLFIKRIMQVDMNLIKLNYTQPKPTKSVLGSICVNESYQTLLPIGHTSLKGSRRRKAK